MMKRFLKYGLWSAVILTSALTGSCEDELFDDCIEGNNLKSVENRILSEFQSIDLKGDYEVEIDTGRNYTAVITADENLIDEITTRVNDGKLIIETRDGVCLDPSHRIVIRITTRSLETLGIFGSSSVYCDGLKSDALTIGIWGSGNVDFNHIISQSASLEIYGSGRIDCSIVAEILHTKISGSGKIRLEGENSSASHIIIGSGKLESEEMNSVQCAVEISGSGIAEVNAQQTLNVLIAGSGIVYYLNNPEITKSISGSGKLIHR